MRRFCSVPALMILLIHLPGNAASAQTHRAFLVEASPVFYVNQRTPVAFVRTGVEIAAFQMRAGVLVPRVRYDPSVLVGEKDGVRFEEQEDLREVTLGGSAAALATLAKRGSMALYAGAEGTYLNSQIRAPKVVITGGHGHFGDVEERQDRFLYLSALVGVRLQGEWLRAYMESGFGRASNTNDFSYEVETTRRFWGLTQVAFGLGLKL